MQADMDFPVCYAQDESSMFRVQVVLTAIRHSRRLPVWPNFRLIRKLNIKRQKPIL